MGVGVGTGMANDRCRCRRGGPTCACRRFVDCGHLPAQARPFCVPDKAWDLDAYDTLTHAWRLVFGPVYPDDPELPAESSESSGICGNL